MEPNQLDVINFINNWETRNLIAEAQLIWPVLWLAFMKVFVIKKRVIGLEKKVMRKNIKTDEVKISKIKTMCPIVKLFTKHVKDK